MTDTSEYANATGASTIWTALGLDDAARERLRAVLAARPRGLLTDVDGTISAIAPTPEAATLLPGVRELLLQAREVFDLVAAISGRAAADARRMVGVDGIAYIGNHGLETLDTTGAQSIAPEAAPYTSAIAATLDAAERDLASRFPGLRVERKGITGSVHVRQTAHPAAAENAVAEALTALAAPHGLHVTRGKLVVELRPPVAIDKGEAVRRLVREHGLRGAIYLGDDRTDLDAFHALHALAAASGFAGCAVAVLHAEAPADLAASADLALPSVARVPAFLRALLTYPPSPPPLRGKGES